MQQPSGVVPGSDATDGAALDSLWRYYDEHAAQARQHEDLRAKVTSTLAAIAAGVVGLAGVGGLDRSDIPSGIVVTTIGILGVALCIKHYERNRFHTKVLLETRESIDQMIAGGDTIQSIRKGATKRHRKDFRVVRRSSSRESPWIDVRLNLLWLGLPVAIALTGAIVIVLSAIGVDGPSG